MKKQISEKQIEQIVDRLINRVEDANLVFLEEIGSSIAQFKEVTPSKAHQLMQILKYGGRYDEIISEISRLTNLNIKEIDSIFKEYSIKDKKFYEEFYKYRDIPFDLTESVTQKKYRETLTNIVKTEMYNFTRSNVLGYTIKDLEGNSVFYSIRDTYNKLLDTAFLNVGQGKETFDTAVFKILKEVGESGLKTINYESGKAIRLDSAIRMQLKSRLAELHNENQKIFGQEFGSDGVEISVHLNPAEDHQEVQGRQFYNDEFEKLQLTGIGKDINDKEIDLHKQNKDGKEQKTHRPISEMNCYHYIFSIIVGVSDPEYSEKELNKIIKDNEKGFEYNDKHYTNYEGTQLMRKLENEIRKQKDTQILAKSSQNDLLLYKSQDNIRKLTKEYKKISEISNLPIQNNRLRVSGYKRVAKK